jgi:predicted RNA-binding protein with PIN domain
VTLFVDGYNLIFAASRKLPGFDMKRTEAAREALLSLLAKFRSIRSDRGVVFFDGGPEAAHLPRRQTARGMEVIFSEARSDADSDIKEAISHEANPRAVVVVTSDAAIRRFVERYGATVTDSAAFLDEVENALKESSIPSDEPIEKYEGAAGDDAAYWLRVFGESEPKDENGEGD